MTILLHLKLCLGKNLSQSIIEMHCLLVKTFKAVHGLTDNESLKNI